VSEAQPDIEELFHAARALRDAAARAAFVEQATRGDTSLRRRLEALLAADARTGERFLEPRAAAPLVPAPKAGSAVAGSAAPGEKAGDTIDRYKLLEAIGEGGMGTVWMAEQREPVVRKVALKIIKLGMDTREVVVRFEAERQALALMDHPHIAKVLDGGATATGRPYFVMELVRGVPITQYCDSAKLSLRERLELFTRVCEAIQHAHHKGVIHRDIKPSNVLVTLHDGVPVPKVIDFGIAKATSAELTKKTLFTQYAQIIGTPEYMAPEQAEMSGLDIDTRADVYSLGVLLYELLTGTKPFDIKSALAVGFDELLRTIREVDPAKPSTRVSTLRERASPIGDGRTLDVESWSRRLRGDLDWIVMKALEKDRSRRYESASGFAADIGRFLRDEAVVAAPPSAMYRVRKFVQRRRKTVAAVAVLALSLVGGIVGTSIGLVRALDEKERADLATKNEVAAKEEALANAELAEREARRAEDEAARAAEEAARARTAEAEATARAAEIERVAQFQAAQITRVDPRAMGRELRADLLAALPEGRRVELAAALAPVNFTNLALAALDTNLLQPSIAAIDEQFADAPLVQARLLLSLAQTMKALGLHDAAADPAERAFDLTVEHLGADHPNTLTAVAIYAELCFESGRFTDAERLHTIAYEKRRVVFGEDAPLTWTSLYALGRTWCAQGRFDEAERAYRDSLAAMERLSGADHDDTLYALNALCVLLQEIGRTDEAEPRMRDLLERTKRRFGAQSLEYLTAQVNFASLVSELGHAEEGEQNARAAHAGLRELLGDDHASTINALSTLGVSLQEQRRFEECLPILIEVYEARRRVLGAEHPSTLSSGLNLGTVLPEFGRFDEAEAVLGEAINGLQRVVGAEHPDTIAAVNRLGTLRVSQGRLEEGLEILLGSLDATRRAYGAQATETIAALNNVGQALWMVGRFAEAATHFEESLAACRRTFGDGHPNTAMAAANLGVNLDESGRSVEAIAPLEEAWRLLRSDPSLLWLANTLVRCYLAAGRVEDARALAVDVLGQVRTMRGGDELERASTLANLGGDLLAMGDATNAELALRECVEVRERVQPDAWNTFNARSMLGGALAAQGRFAEAEPLLLAGQAGLAERVASIPPQARNRVTESVARLVNFYSAWHAAEPDAGHDARAQEWRAKLGP
jgi:tetratricopeptide (TPR) repeat protein